MIIECLICEKIVKKNDDYYCLSVRKIDLIILINKS